MMRTPRAATDPWGMEIDNGWKDLVVSSAPPPPPREAMDPVIKNHALPADFNTWQEHGATRAAAVEAPVEEPSFTAGDRRLWVMAGTLMAMATLVLALLGLLTFGNGVAKVEPTAEAPRTAAVVAPARTAAPTRAGANHTSSVAAKATNPRLLKESSRTQHGRPHKHLATR